MEKFVRITETIGIILSVIIYITTGSLKYALLFFGGIPLIVAFFQGFYFLGKKR